MIGFRSRPRVSRPSPRLPSGAKRVPWSAVFGQQDPGPHQRGDEGAQRLDRLGAGDDPQWLYTVVFAGPDLWGEQSDPTVKVSVEAFEPYLEPAA